MRVGSEFSDVQVHSEVDGQDAKIKI